MRSFAQAHPEIGEPTCRTTIARLERVIAATYPLQRGEPKAIAHAVRRIQAIFTWTEGQGVVWPPAAPALDAGGR